MTATLSLRPDADHPAVATVRELHAMLDELDISGPLATGDYAATVAEWERASRRLEAVKLRLVAAADRAGSASLSGMSGTPAWLAKHTTADQATAARSTRLAVELFTKAAAPTATVATRWVKTEGAAQPTGAAEPAPADLGTAKATAVTAAPARSASRSSKARKA